MSMATVKYNLKIKICLKNEVQLAKESSLKESRDRNKRHFYEDI